MSLPGSLTYRTYGYLMVAYAVEKQWGAAIELALVGGGAGYWWCSSVVLTRVFGVLHLHRFIVLVSFSTTARPAAGAAVAAAAAAVSGLNNSSSSNTKSLSRAFPTGLATLVDVSKFGTRFIPSVPAFSTFRLMQYFLWMYRLVRISPRAVCQSPITPRADFMSPITPQHPWC